MFNKSMFAGLVILITFNFVGIVYGKGETTGYLQIIYKSCECGMSLSHVYSCYAPFTITGKKIIGSFEISEDGKIHLPLVPLVPADRYSPDFEKQIIRYSYKCPPADNGCSPTEVNGQVIVHTVGGELLTIKGKRMLHFTIKLSIPYCTVNECGQEHDCSMETWDDEFIAPLQNGYRTERGVNALFTYVVNLQQVRK